MVPRGFHPQRCRVITCTARPRGQAIGGCRMDDPLGGTVDPVARLRDKSLMLQPPERERIAVEIERLRAREKTLENTARINLKVAQDRGTEIERLQKHHGGSA